MILCKKCNNIYFIYKRTAVAEEIIKVNKITLEEEVEETFYDMEEASTCYCLVCGKESNFRYGFSHVLTDEEAARWLKLITSFQNKEVIELNNLSAEEILFVYSLIIEI